jgi:hypothetical protein
MSVTDAPLDRATAASCRRRAGLVAELSTFWHDLIRTMFDPYRPERHYMRGPGPACARKHSRHT